MIPIFFAAKRSFHTSLRVARELLAPFGLTPARYDMLCAISDVRGGIAQADLPGILGVSKPTISRMLRSLEDLGLVARTRYLGDLRQRLVRPTHSGMMRMLEVLHYVIRGGFARLAVDSALLPDDFCDAVECGREMDAVRDTFRRFSRGLGDRATHEYFLGVAA